MEALLFATELDAPIVSELRDQIVHSRPPECATAIPWNFPSSLSGVPDFPDRSSVARIHLCDLRESGRCAALAAAITHNRDQLTSAGGRRSDEGCGRRR
jgi:hypothetical protein